MLKRTVTFISDLLYCAAKILGNIVDEILLLVLFLSKDFPEFPRLNEIFVRDLSLKVHDRANPFLVGRTLFILRGLDYLGLEVAWDIIGRRSIIGDIAYAITSSRVVGIEWLVDRYVVEIHTETVPLRRAIGKETDLENWKSS